MIRDAIKSYKSDNRGSAIITGLVVSAVLMVLCLSLLLVAYSLFLSTSNAALDMPNKEMLYSAADVIGEEITSQTVDVNTYTVITENSGTEGQENTTVTAVPSELWDAIYKGISTGVWPYFKTGVDGHSDLEACSKYYQMTSIGSVKIIVQLYWEPPKEWSGQYDQLDGAVLNAIYRLYNNKNKVLMKGEKKYNLTVNSSNTSEEGGNADNNYIIRENPYKTNSQGWLYYGFDNADVIFKHFDSNGQSAQLELYSNNNIKTEDWAFDIYLDGVSNITTTDPYNFLIEKLEDGWFRIKSNSNYTKVLWTEHFFITINYSGTYTSNPKIRQRNTGDISQQPSSTTQTIEQKIYLQYDGFTSESWSSINSYTNHMKFTNNQTTSIDNWTIEFNYPATVNSDGYQGTADEIESNGQFHKIRDRGGNGFDSVKPGQQVTVTFSGNGEGFDSEPTDVKIYTIVKTEIGTEPVSIITWKWNKIG